MSSLWGEEFNIPETPKTAKKIINKIKEPKVPKEITKRSLNSKNIKLEDKIPVITKEVERILGSFKDNTLVIRDLDSLSYYIDSCISNGIVAVDTETTSLDPLTLTLVGVCLYTPGQKNAYIPINHININTQERLPNQISESQIKHQLERLNDIKILMHNGNFDYQVIKCTCNVILSVYWDTFLAARIWNENEKAGLKYQYVLHIDPNQEKYDIENLFEKLPGSFFDPDLFALYAATDSYLTYKLYEWQKYHFDLPENKKLKELFMDVEMKALIPTAEMELNGVSVDLEYTKRLSKKYHDQLDKVEKDIEKELHKYDEKISAWRLTDVANFHPNKTDKNGNVTQAKSKNEQLENPVKLSSNTQLGILLYDILKVEPIYKKRSKSEDKKTVTVDEEAINQIYEKTKLPLLELIIKRRKLEKLLGTYIDKIPECLSVVDGKLHASYNQIGTDTGRYSSSDPNMQNIPSKGNMKDIRMMFCASNDIFDTPINNGVAQFYSYNEIELVDGWKFIDRVDIGDILVTGERVSKIDIKDNVYYLTIGDEYIAQKSHPIIAKL